MASSNGITIYHGYYWFWQLPYFFMQIQDVQPRNPIISNISSDSFYILISTTAKSFITCSRNNNNINFIIFSANFKRVEHFSICFRPKCIIYLGSINCYFCNTIKKIKFNVLVIFYFFPAYFHIIKG